MNKKCYALWNTTKRSVMLYFFFLLFIYVILFFMWGLESLIMHFDERRWYEGES